MILVAGASGNMSGEMVRALLDQGQRVRVLTRKGTEPGLPADAERVPGDLDESMVLPAVPDLTGRPARTFGQWAAAHAAAFD